LLFYCFRYVEKFEDTKGVIRSRKSIDTQYNSRHKNKDKTMTYKALQTKLMIQKQQQQNKQPNTHTLVYGLTLVINISLSDDVRIV
jgi:intein-encoded DNA endonuclease-like protein